MERCPSTSPLLKFERDDTWIVLSASKDVLELQNPRTRDKIPLGTDHVREYMSDPGSIEGFLILKSQIFVFARAQAIVEPLRPQPSPQQSRPVGMADRKGETIIGLI